MVFVKPSVGVYQNIRNFKIPCNHRGYCRALNAHCRRAEFAVYERIVQHAVGNYRNYARLHGHYRFARFPERCAVSLAQHKRRQPPQHNIHIILRLFKRSRKRFRRVHLFIQVKPNKVFPEQGKYKRSRNGNKRAYYHFEPEAMLNAFVVPNAGILRGIYAGAGKRAEYAQIEYEYKLINYGNAGYGRG